MIEASVRLRRAIRMDDALLVQRILKSHPHLLHNPDASSSGNCDSNLHLAASLGHQSICALLLSLGHEFDGPALNDSHQTALMLAARAGHAEVVHLLCQHDPAAILRQDAQRRDAVMLAAMGGHDTAVQLLLTHAPGGPEQALAQADVDGNTALHFASAGGHMPVLRTLLAAGADSTRVNSWEWTALAYSPTVGAEAYMTGLVKEAERRRQTRREVEELKKGGAVRVVDEDGD